MSRLACCVLFGRSGIHSDNFVPPPFGQLCWRMALVTMASLTVTIAEDEACSLDWADCPGATPSYHPELTTPSTRKLLPQPPLGSTNLSAKDGETNCSEDTLLPGPPCNRSMGTTFLQRAGLQPENRLRRLRWDREFVLHGRLPPRQI